MLSFVFLSSITHTCLCTELPWSCFMLEFIKMKLHKGYLIYYSVLFVFIVFLAVIKNCSANWSQRKKKFRIARAALFYVFSFDQWRWKLRQESHLRKKITINFISARFSKSINLIQSSTTLFAKKIKLNKNKIKQERSLIPQSNRFVGD